MLRRDVKDGCLIARVGFEDLFVSILVHAQIRTVSNLRWRSRASSQLLGFLVIQEVAKAAHAVAGEDAENVALVVVKLRRSLSAEGQDLFS